MVNGVRTHYLKAGRGEPVILIHGFTGNHAMWYLQVPALAKRYRVIAYDARGHGDSEHPGSGYDLSTLVSDLAGLMDQLEIQKAHLVGLSMGGMIVQRFGLAFPERAADLTIADSFPGRPDAKVLEIFQEHVQIGRDQGLTVLFARLLVHPALPIGPDFRVPLPFVKAFQDAFLKNRLATMAAFVEMFLGLPDWSQELQNIKSPTLLIVGDHDLPCLAPMQKMAGQIPDSELFIIPRCGHSSPLEKADRFNELLLKFVEKHPL